jgi:hypothetical protein
VPAAAGLLVFAGSLGYSFSQDDFTGLARAAGLEPRLPGPWRWISLQAFYDVMRWGFGLDPWPYHLAGLLVHSACAALVGVFLLRWVSAPAAIVAATFYAAHAALFTAVYWIAALGDSLAVLFAVATLVVARRHGPARFLALPLFACSLASKESTLLLPLGLVAIAAAQPGPGSAGRRLARTARDPLHLLLAGCALGFGTILAVAAAHDPAFERTAAAPYAVAVGGNLWRNLLTYLGWSVNFLVPTVRGFSDAVDPDVFAWGAALAGLWLAGLGSGALRRRGWLPAGVLVLVLLAPVLGLRNHTYHYYLAAPLVGIAWLVAAGADLVLPAGAARSRREAPRAAGWAPLAVAVLVAAGLAWNGRTLVHRIETEPFPHYGLRADPTVDRALVFERVRAGVARGSVPPGSTLVFWSPARAVPGADPAAPESYWERNVRIALMNGLAVRLFFPTAARVEFARTRPPASAGQRYVVYGLDGRSDVFTPAALDSILRLAGAVEPGRPER